jgi:hypothetical protein
MERRPDGVVIRLPLRNLGLVLSIWVTALLISIALTSGLAWLLWQARAWDHLSGSLCAAAALLIIVLPLLLSAISAATNLTRGVTECIVQAELRVKDKILSVRIPGFCRAIEYEWQRGEVENLRLIRPKSSSRKQWMDLWVLSLDGHEARIALIFPGEDSAAAMEQALRAALGSGEDIDWDPPGPALPQIV